MLTKQYGMYAKEKLFALLSLIVICIAFSTTKGFSQEKKWEGNIVSFKGNKFEMKVFPVDTIAVEDSITNKFTNKMLKRAPRPIKMNGETIHDEDEIETDRAKMEGAEQTLIEYLVRKLEKNFEQLPDGRYSMSLSSIVVDKEGHIVYYDYSGKRGDGKGFPIEAGKLFAGEAQQMLDEVKMKPAQLNGKRVICWLSSNEPSIAVTVKDHKVVL